MVLLLPLSWEMRRSGGTITLFFPLPSPLPLHRYIFRDAQKVGIQELGPRLTLKLRSLQKGTFDSKYGEYVWVHKV